MPNCFTQEMSPEELEVHRNLTGFNEVQILSRPLDEIWRWLGTTPRRLRQKDPSLLTRVEATALSVHVWLCAPEGWAKAVQDRKAELDLEHQMILEESRYASIMRGWEAELEMAESRAEYFAEREGF